MSFSITSRQDDIQQLKTKELDLLIVGGGITGAGVALQASVAGMQTGLIDMQDFGGGPLHGQPDLFMAEFAI